MIKENRIIDMMTALGRRSIHFEEVGRVLYYYVVKRVQISGNNG